MDLVGKGIMDASAFGPSGVVLFKPFKWDILCPFLIKNLVIFVRATQNFFLEPQEQEGCRWQTQCSSKLCGWLCTQPIWCCPLQPFHMRYFVVYLFLIKILVDFSPFHHNELNFKTYQYLLVGVCCIESPANHLNTTFV